MKDRHLLPRTVAVVGCEHVGVTAVYSLARSSSIDRVIAIGDNAHHLANQVNELLDTLEFDLPKVIPGIISDAARAAILVMAAAPYHIQDESRDDRIHRTYQEVRRQVRDAMDSGFDGIIIVASNPCDLMAEAAFSESGLAFGRVFGLATDKGVEGVTWCTGMHGVNYIDNCDPTCPFFEKVVADYHASAGVGTNGTTAKRSLATCVTRLCEAVFNDEHSLLPVAESAEIDCRSERGFTKIQCIIGRNGIERRLEPPASFGSDPIGGSAAGANKRNRTLSSSRPRRTELF